MNCKDKEKLYFACQIFHLQNYQSHLEAVPLRHRSSEGLSPKEALMSVIHEQFWNTCIYMTLLKKSFRFLFLFSEFSWYLLSRMWRRDYNSVYHENINYPINIIIFLLLKHLCFWCFCFKKILCKFFSIKRIIKQIT